jgi:putative transcriptional regulator
MPSISFRRLYAGALVLAASVASLAFGQSDSTESLRTGKILVASPDYEDSVFGRSVILLTRYGPDGAAGIMLNRPTPLSVSKALPGAKLSSNFYLGGPVSEDGVFVMVQSVTKPQKAIQVLGDLFVISGNSVLDDTILQPPGQQLHAYLGFCEWKPGQLEDEVRDGAWYTFAGRSDQVFDDEPDSLWPRMIAKLKQNFAALFPKSYVPGRVIAQR